MFLCVSVIHVFLLPGSIPLCEYTIVSWMDLWVVYRLGLL